METIDELRQYYSKLARKANDRLAALKKSALKPEFESILEYSYRGAMYEIKNQRGAGYTRFSGRIPKVKDRRGIEKNIRIVEEFLAKPTSTTRGIIKIYKARADTLNEAGYFDVKFTWKQYAKLFESGMWEKLKADYGSHTAQRMLRRINAKAKDLKENLQAADKILIKGLYDQRLREFIGKNKDDFADYMKVMYDKKGKPRS